MTLSFHGAHTFLPTYINDSLLFILKVSGTLRFTLLDALLLQLLFSLIEGDIAIFE